MIRSAEPGEDWRWCYPDDRLYQARAIAGDPPATASTTTDSGPIHDRIERS
jgi:hypothetical protein